MLKKLFFRTTIEVNISLLLLCSFLSCSKPSPPYRQFSREGLAYIQFNTGKYFIFKDSASGRLDSIVVTKSSLEKYNTSVNSLFGPFEAIGERYYLILSKIDSSGRVTELINGAADNYASDEFIVLRSAATYESLFSYPSPIYNGTIIPSLQVEGKTYTNVVCQNNDRHYSAGILVSSSFYWAKGVGLIKSIKSEASNTKTYTLLRSN